MDSTGYPWGRVRSSKRKPLTKAGMEGIIQVNLSVSKMILRQPKHLRRPQPTRAFHRELLPQARVHLEPPRLVQHLRADSGPKSADESTGGEIVAVGYRLGFDEVAMRGNEALPLGAVVVCGPWDGGIKGVDAVVEDVVEDLEQQLFGEGLHLAGKAGTRDYDAKSIGQRSWESVWV